MLTGLGRAKFFVEPRILGFFVPDIPYFDNESNFLATVAEEIRTAGYARPNRLLKNANIGRTGNWGHPVGSVTQEAVDKFRRYSEVPPECLIGTAPDLIPVDEG